MSDISLFCACAIRCLWQSRREQLDLDGLDRREGARRNRTLQFHAGNSGSDDGEATMAPTTAIKNAGAKATATTRGRPALSNRLAIPLL